MRVPVAILAGGQSTRMGVDKAALPVGEVRMLERLADLAREVTEEVLIVGRPAPAWWNADRFPAVRFIPDATPDAPGAARGPIAGVIAAIREARRPILVLACDMPALRPQTLRDVWNVYQSAAPGAWGAMARSTPRARPLNPPSPPPSPALAPPSPVLEPMLAVYAPAALPTLEAMWMSGRRALYRIAEQHPFALWDVPADRRHELVNLNDPAAYEAFLRAPEKG